MPRSISGDSSLTSATTYVRPPASS